MCLVLPVCCSVSVLLYLLLHAHVRLCASACRYLFAGLNGFNDVCVCVCVCVCVYTRL